MKLYYKILWRQRICLMNVKCVNYRSTVNGRTLVRNFDILRDKIVISPRLFFISG